MPEPFNGVWRTDIEHGHQAPRLLMLSEFGKVKKLENTLVSGGVLATVLVVIIIIILGTPFKNRPPKNLKMTPREKLEELNLEIPELESKIEALQILLSAKTDEKSAAIKDFIFEEKLLEHTIWTLTVRNDKVQFTLDKTENLDNANIKIMSDLLDENFSSWIYINDFIELRSDECELIIYFHDNKLANSFAKKHKLKITGSGVTTNLSKLKKQISTLETIIHQFNIKD